MQERACEIIEYCPFCGKKDTIIVLGEDIVECTNTKCETEPFLIQGGVKERG